MIIVSTKDPAAIQLLPQPPVRRPAPLPTPVFPTRAKSTSAPGFWNSTSLRLRRLRLRLSPLSIRYPIPNSSSHFPIQPEKRTARDLSLATRLNSGGASTQPTPSCDRGAKPASSAFDSGISSSPILPSHCFPGLRFVFPSHFSFLSDL